MPRDGATCWQVCLHSGWLAESAAEFTFSMGEDCWLSSAIIATCSKASARTLISDFEPVRGESGSSLESFCIMLVQSRFESAFG